MLKKITANLIVIAGALMANAAFAVESSKSRLKDIADQSLYPNWSASPQSIVVNIIAYVLGLIGMFFLILIIYSGYQWISAGGNEEIITKAKTRFKNAIIGLAVVIGAYSITSWVLGLINQLPNQP